VLRARQVAAADVRPELDAATSLRNVAARSMSIISHMDLIRCACVRKPFFVRRTVAWFIFSLTAAARVCAAPGRARRGRAHRRHADAGVGTDAHAPSFLHAHVDELGALADASVDSLGLATRDMFVFYVPARLSALRTLVEMDEHKLSAAGVVDEGGELVANLSVSDLRDVPPEKLGLLVRTRRCWLAHHSLLRDTHACCPVLPLRTQALPVLQFLAVQAGCRTPRPAVAVALDATLRDVLTRMVTEARGRARLRVPHACRE
jgi:hypothetical protein